MRACLKTAEPGRVVPDQSPARRAPRRILALLMLLLAGLSLPAAEPAADAEPAEIKVRGFGLLGNRQLLRVIRQLLPEETPPELESNFIHDSLLLMRSRLLNEGYLNATVRARVELADGGEEILEFDREAEILVPREWVATGLRFEVDRGELFYYESLEINGLSALDPKMARGYFHRTEILLKLRSDRRFSPGGFRTSIANLEQELANRGYRNARIEGDARIDHETGAVNATVTVTEGALHQAREVHVTVRDAADGPVADAFTNRFNTPYSQLWSQDLGLELSREQFALGYPDARARLTPGFEPGPQPGVSNVIVSADVIRGPYVELGEVRFVGKGKTRESLLRRKVSLTGPALNRLEVDASRERLARLGVFKNIDVDLVANTNAPGVRDVEFTLTEGRRIDVSLLAGYGSYDQVFGGIEMNQYNLWGRAHNAHMRLVQSIKSTYADYTYTIPDFLVRDLSVFTAIDGLRREELTFDREELKLGIGARQNFPRRGQQVGLRYSYEFLNVPDGVLQTGQPKRTEAAAIIADWNLDRRDNPLAPKRGYRTFVSAEFASRAFGGDAQYQRLESGFSWHKGLGNGLFVHTGITHDIIFADDPLTDIPFNKRFLPGGENSVRGYQRGGASPVDADGRQLGAETATVLNLELEQYLTEKWSVVAFVDGGAFAEDIADHPFDDVLWSAGGGVRWNTVIGPVRLEYGHNLTRRDTDPRGTLHFSIGFPF